MYANDILPPNETITGKKFLYARLAGNTEFDGNIAYLVFESGFKDGDRSNFTVKLST